MKPRTVRILLSSLARKRLEQDIRAIGRNTTIDLVEAGEESDLSRADADFAFISRDVTGLSTKHVLTQSLENFYVGLRASERLRWVHVHSAGADRPIFPELRERGVLVTTSSGANGDVVAQTALAGILSLARQFPRLLSAQRRHEWCSLIKSGLPRDIAGQTAVIVGWGPIGRKLGTFLRALDMRIIVVRSSRESCADACQTVVYEELEHVLPEADWLVLACPLSERTRGLLDNRAIGLLPNTSHLVNVARGEIVDEPALIDALQGGRLAGAFLDVFAHEPLRASSPLWDLPNVLVTPHSAGHSDGNEARVDRMFLERLAALM